MNKSLRHIIIVMLMLLAGVGHAQFEPLLTNYQNNPLILNPSYAGSVQNIIIDGTFRQQWLGIDWSPQTTSISVSSPFRDYRVGIGASFHYDEIGPTQQLGIYLNYAYHIRFDNRTNLSLGLKGGFSYYQLYLHDLKTNEYDSHIALYGHRSLFLPNFGTGFYYYGEKFYIGASIPKLLRNSLNKEDNTLESVGRLDRHFYFTGGYIFDIDDPFLRFKLSYMARIVGTAPVTLDLSGTFIFYDQYMAGLTYRHGDNGNGIAAYVKLKIQENLDLGLSYDLTTSPLRKYNYGTVEVYLSYTFSRRGQRILSPRYF